MAIYAAAIGRHCSIQLQPLDRVRGTPTGRPLRRAAVIAVARKAIEGYGDELNAVAAENMDFAPARRRVRSAFADVHRRLDHFLFKVRSPLLILHGAADKVTDPNVSKILYNMANTNDKTLKLYEEGFHCILEGEPDGRISSVINDIISWLDSHSNKN
ncbi:hypothetical protein BHM03_00059300 [Ensete ventricosum]|uniref:Serine aminopeptidase S33 domain-containing protein n=1 Tax=Ensete ventricosum TaxID=4639 RepID=A0A445MMN7_ENSVE|nr:hypothetical protein BHM03_00059300 [Ensete ventricosum]